MAAELQRIFRAYPDACLPRSIEFLSGAGGFSGSLIWRLETELGPLSLRRWPREYPAAEPLEFIQAVLWHVDQEGFHKVPVPLETNTHAGFVREAGFFWELSPWLPGVADYRQAPSRQRLHAAMTALAQFHQAAATFPLAEVGLTPSPGIARRRKKLEDLLAGGIARLAAAIQPEIWPAAADCARQIIELFRLVAPTVLALLDHAKLLNVPLQPCIRDIWHEHVLFEGESVSGLVDFGALRPENVAADIARLLGSLAGDSASDWQLGLSAYEQIRPLTASERQLITAFDRSAVLMSGIQWIEWIYLEGRTFEAPQRILDRLDENLARLVHLASGQGRD